MTKSIIPGMLVIALLPAWPHAQQPPQPPAPQQPTDVGTTIDGGGGGAAPRLAVPEFIALSPDAETVATASVRIWTGRNIAMFNLCSRLRRVC